jgi:hypothetical protein
LKSSVHLKGCQTTSTGLMIRAKALNETPVWSRTCGILTGLPNQRVNLFQDSAIKSFFANCYILWKTNKTQTLKPPCNCQL